MKKVLILIVLFATLLFAAEFENPKNTIRPGTRLGFFSNYLPFQFGDACNYSFINCVKDMTGDYTPFMGLAYYSTLDTNFVVFINLINSDIILFRTYIGLSIESGNKKIKDMLKHEFMNLQEWNVIDISKDSAEALIDKIIYYMLGGECEWKNMEDSIYTDSMGDIVYPSYIHDATCDTIGCCAEEIDGGAVMIDNWWTLLPDEKPTSISKTRIKNRFRLSRMNRKTFFVEGLDEASPYKIFDVNGILLKQGITENGEVQVPKTPAILDIGHQKILLK